MRGKRDVDKARRLLDSLGARLKRSKKHLVYELPNGRNVVLASTPSDSYHAEQNKLRDIRHAAGIAAAPKSESQPRERRAKPGRRDSRPWSIPVATLAHAPALAELHLRNQLQDAENKIADLRRTVFAREARIAELEQLWVVRCYYYLRRLGLERK